MRTFVLVVLMMCALGLFAQTSYMSTYKGEHIDSVITDAMSLTQFNTAISGTAQKGLKFSAAHTVTTSPFSFEATNAGVSLYSVNGFTNTLSFGLGTYLNTQDQTPIYVANIDTVKGNGTTAYGAYLTPRFGAQTTYRAFGMYISPFLSSAYKHIQNVIGLYMNGVQSTYSTRDTIDYEYGIVSNLSMRGRLGNYALETHSGDVHFGDTVYATLGVKVGSWENATSSWLLSENDSTNKYVTPTQLNNTVYPVVADTMLIGWTPTALTIDSVLYSSIGGVFLKARLEIVDSLNQTSGVTLLDTTTCIWHKVVRTSAVAGGTFSVSAGKAIRLVFPSVATKPRDFNAIIFAR
jgi:hypothetical protein